MTLRQLGCECPASEAVSSVANHFPMPGFIGADATQMALLPFLNPSLDGPQRLADLRGKFCLRQRWILSAKRMDAAIEVI